GGGQRMLAEEAADQDRVDRPVQRLEDRAGERRQSEGEQGPGDRAFSEVAALGCCARHQPSRSNAARRRSASADFASWSARALSTASGLARSVKAELASRWARESRSFSAASAAFERRDFSASKSTIPCK